MMDILDCANTALVVVDLQDGFLKAIHERDRVVANSIRLIEAAKVLSLPILTTLQNVERLGDFTEAVDKALPPVPRPSKMTFSCLGAQGFLETLQATGRRQALICGIETHICITQTALDLLAHGYAVHVPRDAVSSRTPENWIVGIERMRDAGCVITSTEMAIFELVKDASREEFKKILPLVK